MFTPAICPHCTAIVIARSEGGVMSFRCGGCGYGVPVQATGTLIDMTEQRSRRRPPAEGDERPAA